MIAWHLGAVLHSTVPFLIDGFVFELPGLIARMSRSDDRMYAPAQIDKASFESY